MQKQGLTFAFITYLFWGLSPLYWKAFKDFGTSEVLAHRIVWALCFTLVILLFKTQLASLKKLWQPKILRVYAISSLLLAINWFTYIYAVANGYVLESSLGYFITPLVNVGLGYIVLKERLRTWQWITIILCFFGVIYRTITYGSLPVIALTLAITFGIYGLIRKQAPLDAIEGLTFENILLALPAIAFLSYLTLQGEGNFFTNTPVNPVLFLSAGLYTAIPLIFFAAAAKRLELGLLGMLMYLNPTLQFLCGRFIFNEPFDQNGLIAFSIIWIALILFTVEGYLFRNGTRKKARATL